ncbi:MAG TPA: nucleotide sugar dehydrogenase [Mycobacteriales bacterium]|nr:nucleotide sugar dehydrogenase [Mycobacteriales bacterium]
MTSDRKVVVVGQGYVGLPLAMAAVEAGYTVVGYDTDEAKVDALSAGQSYVDDISSEELAQALSSGRYSASSQGKSCAGFDIAVITVPTPLRDGVPDLSFIEAAGTMLARYVRPGSTIILESTTWPGTTEELLAPMIEEASGLSAGVDFHLGYSPERIDPGNRTYTFRTTPKVVSGIGETSLESVRAFYADLVEQVIPVSGTREAELTKLLENTFRHVNIALVNELAMFAHDLDIDIWESIDAASTKPFGFMRFTPGPGVGGHCLPIDPSYLSWRVERTLGQNFRFVELANDINNHMPHYVVGRLTLGLNLRRKSVAGSRVLLLGLTYKANTSDIRESPTLDVAARLVQLGADVRIADPHAPRSFEIPGTVRVEAIGDEVAGADAVILLVAHDEFDLGKIAETAPYLLDAVRATGVVADNVELL